MDVREQGWGEKEGRKKNRNVTPGLLPPARVLGAWAGATEGNAQREGMACRRDRQEGATWCEATALIRQCRRGIIWGLGGPGPGTGPTGSPGVSPKTGALLPHGPTGDGDTGPKLLSARRSATVLPSAAGVPWILGCCWRMESPWTTERVPVPKVQATLSCMPERY